MSFTARAIARSYGVPLATSLLVVACATCAPSPNGEQFRSLADAMLTPRLRQAARTFVTWRLRWQFPDVAGISTAELAAWLADGCRPPPLVLDVRTAEEHAVGHLAGARWIAPMADPATVLADVPRTQPIVVYCAVGYRSAVLARALGAAGYVRVLNLQGAIFAWASEGRPMVRGGQAVSLVHPYDAEWGLLLEPLRRAALSDAM